MTHIEDGRLLAWLDGELDERQGAELEAWLRRDAAASHRLEEVRERRETVRTALERLDVEPPTERVRGRLAAETTRRGSAGGRWMSRSRLAQAALLVLLLAGGASAAIPGSPVRQWLERTLGQGLGSPPALTTASEATDPAEAVGLWMAADDGVLGIELEDVPAGTEIVVTLVEGGRGGVSAPQGTSLRSSEGRLRAAVASGPVRVEMPRTLRRGSLRIDGREYLTVRDGLVELRAPAVERIGDRIRFISEGQQEP